MRWKRRMEGSEMELSDKTLEDGLNRLLDMDFEGIQFEDFEVIPYDKLIGPLYRIALTVMGTGPATMSDLREYVDRLTALHEAAIMSKQCVRSLEERYIELPTDSDGVPIRAGDVLTTSYGEDKVVQTIAYANDRGWLIGFDGQLKLLDPHKTRLTHRVKPTVKDVLMEFANMVRANFDMDTALDEFAEILEVRDE